MAFDYGSIDLGLKNPFKKQGAVTSVRGGLQALVGAALLVLAASRVQEDTGSGWILVIFGVYVLGGGLRALGVGVYSTFRYFVGRNHPTSLAQNFSKSQVSTSQEEKPYVAYTAKSLEEMLVGRKNVTFVEPKGFLARLLHSLFPKLLFMPYPIRNMAQLIFGAWVKTLTAIVAFGFVAFVSLLGFAGEVGKLAFPMYTALLMLYLFFVWRGAGATLSRQAESKIESLGGSDLFRVIFVSIVLPVVLGTCLSLIINKMGVSVASVESWLSLIAELNSGFYLFGILIGATVASGLFAYLLKVRLTKANPVSEVSELRENWQESVHPNEIFINLDNLVMANRRYKEVPNRVYRELDPQLDEQVEGKGGFRGEMIQEVQPQVKPMDCGEDYDKVRLISLVTGNVLALLALIFVVLLAYAVIDVYLFTSTAKTSFAKIFAGASQRSELYKLSSTAAHYLVVGFVLASFGKILANAAHLFYAEIQFESLLIYFKCEGTFTESKISTGTGIYDSTRSENTLVRSSITPWIIVARIVSSTFAASGLRNLEHPRHILEMEKSESDLASIRHDVIDFLKDRESIATITSKRDLGNASQIHQLNEQTRAVTDRSSFEKDTAAAGYLKREDDLGAKEIEG
ncbi:MAG: hypothetical protein ACI9Y1_000342 [Lentisphaeria bacterium]